MSTPESRRREIPWCLADLYLLLEIRGSGAPFRLASMTVETIAASAPADIYEQWLVPSKFKALTEHLLATLQPRNGIRVLDIACGTGIVARRIAGTVGPSGRVTGLDLSAAMIEVARATAEREGRAIDWHTGRAESLPFPDASFDLVTCQQGLQFTVDKPAAVAEMRRVLAPGGAIAVSVWQGLDRHPVYAALHAAVLRVLHVPAFQAPFSLGDVELGQLFQNIGFARATIESVTIEARYVYPERFAELMLESASAAIPVLQQLDAGARAELIAGVKEEMVAPIRTYTVDAELRFPVHAHLVRAAR
jgi:ubiquinone/menaquinone biosynthesis C-methylase UbiE